MWHWFWNWITGSGQEDLEETDVRSWINNEEIVIGVWIESCLCYGVVESIAKWLPFVA